MVTDFTFEQVMRLSTIKRWGIIDMSRDQSVAEHTYNVTMIARALVKAYNNASGTKNTEYGLNEITNWALIHDLPEVVTGDIPTPVKDYIGGAVSDMELEMFPETTSTYEYLSDINKRIIKIADLVDAYQFAKRFCVDARKDDILGEMYAKIFTACRMPKSDGSLFLSTHLITALERVWPDAKTH